MAELVHEGRPIGQVRRTLAIGFAPDGVRFEAQVVGASGAALRLESAVVAPDLTVRIVPGPDAGDWACSVSSPLLKELRNPGRLAVGAASADRQAGPMECTAAFIDRNVSDLQRRDALTGAGRALFRASPRVFQQALWALVDAGLPLRTIFVATGEPEFPWELLVPHRGSSELSPLGVEYVVGSLGQRRCQCAPPAPATTVSTHPGTDVLARQAPGAH